MKYWTVGLLLTLVSLNACTGIDPIDNLLDPPKKATRNITFHNSGTADAKVDLSWGDIVSDNRCEPYHGSQSVVVSAGASQNLSMTKTCRYGGYFSLSVTLLPNVAFASVWFVDPTVAAALKPGQQILLSTDDFSVQTTLTILNENTEGQRGGAWVHSDSLPDSTPAWELVVEVPANMQGRALVFGIPAALGIRSLDDKPLHLVNGMYTTPAPVKNGVTIAPDVGADSIITCSEASCRVQRR